MTMASPPKDLHHFTAAEFATFAGRSRQWVHNLIRDGWISADDAMKGRYPLAALVCGVMAYYEDQGKRETTKDVVARVTEARAREIELRISMKERELIPRDDATLAIDLVVGVVNQQLSGLPARITRDLEQRRRVEGLIDEAKAEIARSVAGSAGLIEEGLDPSETFTEDDA